MSDSDNGPSMWAELLEDVTSLVALVCLTGLGLYYLAVVTEPRPEIVLTVIGSVAGLGGYSVRQRGLNR